MRSFCVLWMMNRYIRAAHASSAKTINPVGEHISTALPVQSCSKYHPEPMEASPQDPSTDNQRISTLYPGTAWTLSSLTV